MFLAILAMARMTTAPSMTLLYAGLESSAAGDVVRSLEQRGVAFDVRGGSIFVDSKERDQLRLTLASEEMAVPPALRTSAVPREFVNDREYQVRLVVHVIVLRKAATTQLPHMSEPRCIDH